MIKITIGGLEQATNQQFREGKNILMPNSI